MIEQQVNIKILLPDIKVVLATDKSETRAQFQQEFFHMPDQFGFQFTFMKGLLNSQKINDNKGLSVGWPQVLTEGMEAGRQNYWPHGLDG